MCDEVSDADARIASTISRRGVVTFAGGAALASALPGQLLAAPTGKLEVAGQAVSVTTPDGTANGWFAAPLRGRHAPVVLWSDIYGLRPAYEQMAERLAADGYAVLVINPFYRSGPGPFVGPDDPKDAATWARIMPARGLLTGAAATRDTVACLDYLAAQRSVDPGRKAAVIGYCMGGQIGLRAAGALPDRIGAVCSFHGGAMVTDDVDSPHLSIAAGKAQYLIAVAQNDDRQFPEDKARLRAAFDHAGLTASVEVYSALHGWCPPDSPTYNVVQAEVAWAAMLRLFIRALA